MSFRYYDPIIKVILKKMSKESRQFYSQQTDDKLNQEKERNIWYALKQHFLKPLTQSDKLSYRFSRVNVVQEKEKKAFTFDPEKTKHAKTLQRSQYLYVEDQTDRLQHLAKFDIQKKENDHPIRGNLEVRKPKKPKREELNKFYISFQHEREVVRKREAFMFW